MSGTEKPTSGNAKDSFEVPVKKSPLFLFAMLQIPIVIFMVVMIYILYKTQFS
jgi:hypothetical protein